MSNISMSESKEILVTSFTEELERNDDSIERKQILSESRQKIPLPSMAREQTEEEYQLKPSIIVNQKLTEKQSKQSRVSSGDTTVASTTRRNGYTGPSPENMGLQRNRDSSHSRDRHSMKPPLRRLTKNPAHSAINVIPPSKRPPKTNRVLISSY